MKKLIPRKTVVKRAAALIMGMAALFFMCGCAGSYQPEAQEKMQEMAKKRDMGFPETETASLKTDKDSMTVYFLDVGQGNAILAECGGHYMLVDGGDESKTTYVIEYLKNAGVDSLDYVVASHYDADHLSGIVEVLKTYDCDQIFSGDYKADTEVYEDYKSVVDKLGIREIHPHQGATYKLGKASFTIVCPLDYDHQLENDNSIGLRIVFGNTSFLICGDASEESEEEMLKSGEMLKSDVYMASHHGSRSSSSWNFLKETDPQAVVISAGYGNAFSHPSKAVMSRIRRLGADLYRTDLQGDIIALSDGRKITWNVNPCRDYRDGSQGLAA